LLHCLKRELAQPLFVGVWRTFDGSDGPQLVCNTSHVWSYVEGYFFSVTSLVTVDGRAFAPLAHSAEVALLRSTVFIAGCALK
jgi:hypothetical protein